MSSYARFRNSLRCEFPRERRSQVSAWQKFFFFFNSLTLIQLGTLFLRNTVGLRGETDVVSLVSAGFSAE